MFDRLDAVVFHPVRRAAYFFRHSHYIKFQPVTGVQPLAGSKVRRIGVDGWRTLPQGFRSDLDAALDYPNGHIYFFKGSQYVKYKPGEGVVPAAAGSLIRTIGETGWRSFPVEFRTHLDAAMFYPPNGHAYFFKGDRYIKYRPGAGVVPIGGEDIRTLGVTGWQDLPDAFKQGVNASFYYPAKDRLYFFRGRNYVRWRHGEGVDPGYPRRFGLRHRDNGGWPGLSTVLGGPIAGCVTSDSALIWLWLTGGRTPADLKIRLDDVDVAAPAFLPPEIGTEATDIAEGVDGVDAGSVVTQVLLPGLASNASHQVDICRADDGSVIESISFRTPPRDNVAARVRIGLGSCANSTVQASVSAFTGLAGKKPDLLILCGDNCYYYNSSRNDTSRGVTHLFGVPLPHDWASVTSMLVRQIEARNLPQFLPLARQAAVFSTWDDHDFSYNNCDGFKDADDPAWVGRHRAAGVYRLMWNHPYRKDGNHIYYDFHWGPLHVFMTDGRFHSNRQSWILGDTQLARLIDGLIKSTAPVKIVVLGSQLIPGNSVESFPLAAANERERLLAAIGRDVTGRVLVFSGDVHYSEVQRFPEGSRTPLVVEVTSSPLRIDDEKGVQKADPNRLWHTVQESFAVVDINVTGTAAGGVTGSVTIEACDAEGHVRTSDGPSGVCRSVWNLATGELT